MAQALIGISGWQYPDFEGKCYPRGLEKIAQLTYYANYFPTVEINSTFYHLPKETTVKNWVSRVPGDFIFSIKASRYITHLKNLLDPEETLPKLFQRVALFKEKCGPILFQLPPHCQCEKERLHNFLVHLPGDHRHTIEFRHQSWFKEEVYRILREFNVSLCIYDFNYQQSPVEITSDFIYIRLYGPGRAYYDSYDLDTLKNWKDQIRGWVRVGHDVYCYFDNTHQGYAWINARTLLNLFMG